MPHAPRPAARSRRLCRALCAMIHTSAASSVQYRATEPRLSPPPADAEDDSPSCRHAPLHPTPPTHLITPDCPASSSSASPRSIPAARYVPHALAGPRRSLETWSRSSASTPHLDFLFRRPRRSNARRDVQSSIAHRSSLIVHRSSIIGACDVDITPRTAHVHQLSSPPWFCGLAAGGQRPAVGGGRLTVGGGQGNSAGAR
ncbi:hypothetical protein C8Q79DRAFT_450076 [Trametes meyenii]|nr:hypothetical protein C8Q79DRAFT_450076 [Trametes meyenii]